MCGCFPVGFTVCLSSKLPIWICIWESSDSLLFRNDVHLYVSSGTCCGRVHVTERWFCLFTVLKHF
jgi:hypothetical protein